MTVIVITSVFAVDKVYLVGSWSGSQGEPWNKEIAIPQLPWASEVLMFPSGDMNVHNTSHVNRPPASSCTFTSVFPRRSNGLQISFKFSIIPFWKGQWSSCLRSFGEPKGKIGHYKEHKRFASHTLARALLSECRARWRRIDSGGGKKDDFVSKAGCPHLAGINGM